MICKLCNNSFGRQGGSFNKHLLEEHNILNYLDYVIKTEFNDEYPLCGCGCGLKTTYHNNKFKKFILGHNSTLGSNILKESRPNKNIVDLYNSGKTLEEISNLVKIDRSYISRIVKEYTNIRDSSLCKIKYKIDESIFEKIDSEESAYWFGFLYADGYINYNKNSITLCLSNNDLDILQKFLKFIKTDKPIRKNNKDSSKVVIENKKITNDLKKLGLLQCKTHILSFPKIRKNLLNHFIRGYFDGDGCITYGRKLNTFANVSITSTLNFLKEIDNNIDVKFSYTKRHKDKVDDIFTMTSGGIVNIMKFYSFIYKNSSIYMDRKKKKFNDWFIFYFSNTKCQPNTIKIKKLLKI